MPAASTMVFARTSPCAVTTPTARPCSRIRPVTLQFSTMLAPRARAAAASACVVSTGLVWPSVGRKIPPAMSATFASG